MKLVFWVAKAKNGTETLIGKTKQNVMSQAINTGFKFECLQKAAVEYCNAFDLLIKLHSDTPPIEVLREYDTNGNVTVDNGQDATDIEATQEAA